MPDLQLDANENVPKDVPTEVIPVKAVPAKAVPVQVVPAKVVLAKVVTSLCFCKCVERWHCKSHRSNSDECQQDSNGIL